MTTYTSYRQALETETFREKHGLHIVVALMALLGGIVVWQAVQTSFAHIGGAL